MIPRLKPYFDSREVLAALTVGKHAADDFEAEFAATFDAKYALAFPYGRSALYSLFDVLGIKGADIVMPSYSCVVVAHSIVLSGNNPSFVDISLLDYNMDLDALAATLNDKTRVVIPTHLFGYPMDTKGVNKLCGEQGDIVVVQDCAHSFGAKFGGSYVCNHGDVAIFGLNISKQVSSVFGGMLTTNDEGLYNKLRAYRDANFSKPHLLRQIYKFFYLIAVWFGFNYNVYGIANFLEENTPLLDVFVKYYDERKIDLPRDLMQRMGDIEARVGLAQLKKYGEIREKRIFNAEYYDRQLRGIEGIELPPIVEGATYSHYVPRLDGRDRLINQMRTRGVQVGRLIEYSIPHMQAYRKYKVGDFPNSLHCSKTTINLPNYPSLKKEDLDYIISNLKQVF